jgi:hypothetical protein
LLPTNASSGVAEEVSEEEAEVSDVDLHARDAMMAMITIGNKALTIENDMASEDVVVGAEV